MMRKIGNRVLCYAAVFGILWGITEVLLGTLLHILPLGSISGLIMYPIGFYCLFRIFNLTGNYMGVFLGSMISAALKMSALLFSPPALYFSVLKPALCILLEGAATALVLFIASTAMAEKPHEKLHGYLAR